MKYALILAFMATSFAAGWQLRDLQAQRDAAHIQGNHAQQLAISQQRARQRERHLQQQMEVLQHETQQQLVEIRDIERIAADSRVRELAAEYAAGAKRSYPPATDGCTAEKNRAAVLAELLTDLDQLAGQFAATADRNRISGLACEKAYKTLQSR